MATVVSDVQPISVERLEFVRKKYLRDWGRSAAVLSAQGIYEWMAQPLEALDTVVEIGTGDGISTAVLAKRGHRVIAIEENPECIKKTVSRLEEQQIGVRAIKRGRYRHVSGGLLKHEYLAFSAERPTKGQVLIVQGDAANDAAFWTWLTAGGPVDGIACWLIGTHGGQRSNVRYALTGVETPMHYRFTVQAAVYKAADLALRAGGLIQVVDRGFLPTAEAEQSPELELHKGDHLRMTQGTSIRLEKPSARPYAEATSDDQGMKMMFEGTQAQLSGLATKQLFAISVLGQKT